MNDVTETGLGCDQCKKFVRQLFESPDFCGELICQACHTKAKNRIRKQVEIDHYLWRLKAFGVDDE